MQLCWHQIKAETWLKGFRKSVQVESEINGEVEFQKPNSQRLSEHANRVSALSVSYSYSSFSAPEKQDLLHRVGASSVKKVPDNWLFAANGEFPGIVSTEAKVSVCEVSSRRGYLGHVKGWVTQEIVQNC